MTKDQYKEAKDLESYIRASLHNRTSSSPIKARRLEALYVDITQDNKIKRGCTSCMLDKIMPTIITHIEGHELDENTEPENNTLDIPLEDIPKTHHLTLKKAILQTHNEFFIKEILSIDQRPIIVKACKDRLQQLDA